MVILVPLLVALIGLVVYALAGGAKTAEVGRIAYFTGLLVTLIDLGGAAVKLLTR